MDSSAPEIFNLKLPSSIANLNFEMQPNAWSCAPTALKNAMLVLGKRASVARLAYMASANEDGCDEHGLKNAAFQCGFRLPQTSCYTGDFAKATIRATVPSILCVDKDHEGSFAHWITVVHANARHVWVADPARPGPVLRRCTWKQVLERLHVWTTTADSPNFYVYPLVRIK